MRSWANSIEEKYDLNPTPEKAPQKGLTRIEIEQSIKTKQIPPKLQLQTIISKTLKEYPEIPEFIDSLQRQNVSVRFRTKDEQIAGVSFGFDDYAFKGGSLGTDFTWNGLQKKGLIYEPERHYARLEKSIGRGDRTESGKSEEFIGDSTPEIGIGEDQIGVTRISQSAKSNQRFIEKSDGEIEIGNEEKLRRLGRNGRGEDEATGRIESEVDEEIATQEKIATITANSEDEYFREQERIRVLNQSSGGNLLPAADLPNDEFVLRGGEALGTGTDASILAGNGTGNSLSDPPNSLADISVSKGNLEDALRHNVADNDNAGSDVGADVSVFSDFSVSSTFFRNPLLDGGTGEPVHEELEDFSVKFRKSLDDAESTTKETLSIEEDLKMDEAEKLEEHHEEIEMEEVRVLSM